MSTTSDTSLFRCSHCNKNQDDHELYKNLNYCCARDTLYYKCSNCEQYNNVISVKRIHEDCPEKGALKNFKLLLADNSNPHNVNYYDNPFRIHIFKDICCTTNSKKPVHIVCVVMHFPCENGCRDCCYSLIDAAVYMSSYDGHGARLNPGPKKAVHFPPNKDPIAQHVEYLQHCIDNNFNGSVVNFVSDSGESNAESGGDNDDVDDGFTYVEMQLD
jgi:hypothetical protein